jgi:hypothetical protein
MVKHALLKNLKSKKTSAQIVIKIHRMIEKVKKAEIEKEKNLEKEKEKK